MTIWTCLKGNDLLEVRVGYTCNNKCIHCGLEPARRELEEKREKVNLSTGEIIAVMDRAIDKGVKRVLLAGGEVSLRSDFVKLVSYAVSRSVKVTVQTNGRMFSYPKFCSAMKHLEGVSFIVSVHGSNELVHDAVTKVPGSFYETISAIKNLKAMHKDVSARMIVSKLNCGDLVNATGFVKEMGMDRFCVAFPHAQGYTKEEYAAVVPRYSAIRAQLREVATFSEQEDFPVTFETFPYCVCRESRAFWSRNCDILTKTSLIDNGSGKHQWRDLLMWEELRSGLKAKGERCVDCVFDQMCYGPWKEYAAMYGLEEFVPVQEPEIATCSSSLSVQFS